MPVDTLIRKLIVKVLVEKLKGYREKEIAIAREILFGEISKGNHLLDTLIQNDDFLRMLLRYERAVRDGVTNKNLRLMASIIRGTVECDELNSDKCNYLQSIIAELSEVEIKFLFLFKNIDPHIENDGQKISNQYIAAESNLVGKDKLFETTEDMNALCARLSRTGLISYHSWLDGGGYLLTPLFDKVIELIGLQTFNNISMQ